MHWPVTNVHPPAVSMSSAPDPSSSDDATRAPQTSETSSPESGAPTDENKATKSAAPSAAEPTDEQTAPAESATAPDKSAAPRTQRIKIGTQRYGTPAPKAVAHPVLAPPPSARHADDAAQASDVGKQSPSTSGDEDSDTASTGPDNATAAGTAKKKPGNKSRAERPLNEQPPRKYPPPNIRDQLSPELEMEYLEALGGQSIDDIIDAEAGAATAELEPESRHQGKVISVHREDVFVEIGRQQGMVPLKSFSEPPEVGAVVDVVVSRFNAADGIYELILPGAAVDVGDWSEVAEGMIVEARITGHNKGGLECEVSQLRGFIPASQVSMYRVDDLSTCVGEIYKCVVTEANPEKRNLVLSRRAIMEREKAEAKEQLMASLQVGQIHEGTVRSLQNFGAFVDIGGVDGLIHISQLSWDRIKHPNEVLEVDQKVRVKIQKIDPDTGKIGLAFRDLSESPWSTAEADYPVASRVKGRVTRLMDFGAFVRLGPGVEGLIHISELAHRRVMRVSDVVSEDKEGEVQVLSVDTEAQRISLSLKALEATPSSEKQQATDEADDEPDTPPPPPKKRKTPLRGGIGGPPTGERFGLKW